MYQIPFGVSIVKSLATMKATVLSPKDQCATMKATVLSPKDQCANDVDLEIMTIKVFTVKIKQNV